MVEALLYHEPLNVISFGASSMPPLQRICRCLPKDLRKACAHSLCVTFVSRGRQAILPPTFGIMTSARIASPCFTRPRFELGLSSRSTSLRQTSSTVMLPQVAGLIVNASRCTQRWPVHATPVVITLTLTTLGVFDDSVLGSPRVVWQLHLCLKSNSVSLSGAGLAIEWSPVRNLLPWLSMATSTISGSLVQCSTRSSGRPLVVQLE